MREAGWYFDRLYDQFSKNGNTDQCDMTHAEFVVNWSRHLRGLAAVVICPYRASIYRNGRS